MRKVTFISCSSKKLDRRSKAKDLYISPLFKLNLEYSKHLKVDKTYILSAKYGLLELNDEIEPYDVTLKCMNVIEKKNWASMVLKQLKMSENINSTCFIFLAGEQYRKYLLKEIKHFQIPLQGMGIGKQLQYLKRATNS